MALILHALLGVLAVPTVSAARRSVAPTQLQTLVSASNATTTQTTDSRLIGTLASMFFAIVPAASSRISKLAGDVTPTVAQNHVNRRTHEPDMILERLKRIKRKWCLRFSNDEATPLRKTFYGLNRRLGNDHPDAIVALSAYAMKLAEIGDPTDAVSLMHDVHKRRERILGQEHPDTLEALNNYALLLNSCGRQAEAEPIMRAALPVRRRILGRYSLKTLAGLNDYVDTLGDLGRDSEAQSLMKYVADRTYQLLGPDDPETTRAFTNLAGGDFGKLQTELKTKDAIKDGISKFAQGKPDWNVFVDDFKVIYQSGVEFEDLETFKRLFQVFHSFRDALATQVDVVFLEDYGQNKYSISDPFIEARWTVELRLPFGFLETTLEVEADTEFHIAGNKVDYVKINTAAWKRKSTRSSPKVEHSRDLDTNLKNVKDWSTNIFQGLRALRTLVPS